VELLLALGAALLFAVGTVLLQRAGMDEGAEGSGAGLLVRLARRPLWLAGIAADGLGFAAQAAALSVGRLAVVQPLLATSVVFALPLGSRFTGQRVTGAEVGGALLVVGGLVGFLLVADPSGGRDDAPVGDWLVAGGAIAAVVVPLFLISRRLAPRARAALLGAAAGILFGLSAALTKAVTDELGEGVLEVLVDWHLFALILVGYISMTLNQLALMTGALAPAMATSLAFDPIASVVLGTTLLSESLHETPLGIAATVLALAAALAGMVVLAARRPPPARPRAPSSSEGRGSRSPA
jgi:drug/metabolite transporter (DMT)-like permease